MIIAVNTRLRKKEQPEGYEEFLFGILRSLTERFPQHQFLYIFDRSFDEKMSFPKNALPVIAGPETRNSLRLQYWFNYKIPVILRKHKADVFLSMEGICSLRTKKPQCLLISDLGFLQKSTQKKSQGRFFKKYTPAFLAKAKSIATVSEFSRDEIADRYKMNAENIDVIHPGIDEIFKPVDWQEKEDIKEKYSEGKAYFLYIGEINQRSNTINLLKAFSFFKKRQKSNMLLLLAGSADEIFKKELNSYKFRNDIKLLENLSKAQLAKIIGAAYALVYPVPYADLILSPIQAMGCGIPVICSNTGALPSVCGDAAIYFNPDDSKDMAENMMLLFKDEEKAAELVRNGNALINRYQWGFSADLLMQSILKAYNN